MRVAFRRCRPHLIAAAAFGALVNLLYIAPTLYMLQVYDRVVPTHGVATLGFLTAALLLALATLASLDRVRTRLLVRAGVMLDDAVTPMLLDATFGRPDSPAARAAMRDFDGLRAAITGPAAIALLDAPWMPFYVLVCFLVHPWIGVVALGGIIVLPVIALTNERATRSRIERAQALSQRSYAEHEAVLAAAEAVRALGMRRALVARARRSRSEALALQAEAGFSAGNYLTLTKFVRLALQSLALGLGAWLASDNMISGGAIFASSFLIARALAPVEQLVAGWKGLAQARSAYGSLDLLLAGASTTSEATQLPAPRGGVTLEGGVVRGVSGGDPVLSGISVKIAPGEVVAVIGPSGAGKSTLLRALVGAIAIDRGHVRLDESDLSDWDPERVARHISYLPQEPSLVEGTVKENICRFATELGGDREALDASAVAAAERVGALPLIARLPGGFDYRLGLGGRGVSAGQAQRIALARAMYGSPALLALDEPNAHLDAQGDVALNAAIAGMKAEGRTVVVVSHKLGVLPVVDKVLLLRDGRVEMFGPRDEVLARIAPANVRRLVPAAAGATR
jgi:ATP-binding cassette subfamily C protein